VAKLLLGPMLRYVDETSATVWVETDAPSLVTVTAGGAVTATTGDGAGELRGTANTFQAEGHHYALVELTGLAPGAIHEWIDSQVRGDFDHLLPASSLPSFLPDGLHFAEAWDEAVGDPADHHPDGPGSEREDERSVERAGGSAGELPVA